MQNVLKELMKGRRSDKEYKEIQYENIIVYNVKEMADILIVILSIVLGY